MISILKPLLHRPLHVLNPPPPGRKEIYIATSIGFDALIFILTLVFPVKATRGRPSSPLLRIIERDGSLYFMAVLIWNLFWLILELYGRVRLPFPSLPCTGKWLMMSATQPGLKYVRPSHSIANPSPPH